MFTEIKLDNIGLRYNTEWIFRGINHVFKPNEPTVFLGGNGSGKSTLLKLVSGYVYPSEGVISYHDNHGEVKQEHVYSNISIATPYLELIEEFSLQEVISFHFSLKKMKSDLSVDKIIDLMNLRASANKPLNKFSSGMKQRVKLGLAFFSETIILLLDEPASNLDSQNIEWYREMVKVYTKDRILIVCSNHYSHEYDFCTNQLVIEDYKS